MYICVNVYLCWCILNKEWNFSDGYFFLEGSTLGMRDTSHDFRVQARAGLGNDRFFARTNGIIKNDPIYWEKKNEHIERVAF